ncbi:MAG: 30S ribosomal protein S4 [Nanoarchaeota archaeon]|nr:30S ribosomal protein S4 [Nanoarchaeota archaeon]
MGDTKKQRKQYDTPEHPWQKGRIDSEKEISLEYGLKNKKELWKMASVLKRFKDQVKNLTAKEGKQAELERSQLLNKVNTLGLLQPGQSFDAVLGLEMKDLLERRLQTVVYRKGLARSITQARQFIIHRHVSLNGRVMTVPSYLVKVSEETSVTFHNKSNLFDLEHPERIQKKPSKDKIDVKQKTAVVTEKEKKILTEEEIEAKEIEHALGSEEEQAIKKAEAATPDKEVKEIIEKPKEKK